MFIDDPQRFLILELKEKVATLMERVERKYDLKLLTSINHAIDNLILNRTQEEDYIKRKTIFRSTLTSLSLDLEACVNVPLKRTIKPLLNNLIEWTDDTYD